MHPDNEERRVKREWLQEIARALKHDSLIKRFDFWDQLDNPVSQIAAVVEDARKGVPRERSIMLRLGVRDKEEIKRIAWESGLTDLLNHVEAEVQARMYEKIKNSDDWKSGDRWAQANDEAWGNKLDIKISKAEATKIVAEAFGELTDDSLIGAIERGDSGAGDRGGEEAGS